MGTIVREGRVETKDPEKKKRGEDGVEERFKWDAEVDKTTPTEKQKKWTRGDHVKIFRGGTFNLVWGVLHSHRGGIGKKG